MGQATAAALSSVRAVYNHTPYSPGPTLGESSGTGEQLANFILSFEGRPIPKMLLYLTGDKNRDTVPRILGEADIVVNPVKVYETKFSSNFTRDLEAAFQNVSKSLSPFSRPKFTTSKNNLTLVAEYKQWWIVHFAPSSAQSAIPILRRHFDLNFEKTSPELVSTATSILATAKVASIGPVTTSFLRDELKLHVHATASRPTPQDLVAAIFAHDQEAGVFSDRSSL